MKTLIIIDRIMDAGVGLRTVELYAARQEQPLVYLRDFANGLGHGIHDHEFRQKIRESGDTVFYALPKDQTAAFRDGVISIMPEFDRVFTLRSPTFLFGGPVFEVNKFRGELALQLPS